MLFQPIHTILLHLIDYTFNSFQIIIIIFSRKSQFIINQSKIRTPQNQFDCPYQEHIASYLIIIIQLFLYTKCLNDLILQIFSNNNTELKLILKVRSKQF
ncbi:unnamed protein product [Paramecium sonneborni]|uniref:Uncharacterized protein n=1 Tax=Paramecium sonneborni TaxID=65129 RepID=A0A8S1RA31_9CILI|nr:unnamed protein product [Paramecium sonneborni]